MDRWKHFVDWCQRPSMIKTRRFNPRNIVVLVTFTVILASLIAFGAWSLATPTQPLTPILPPPFLELPTSESNYLPGVSVGDYVTYGDYICNFSHPTGPEWDMQVCMCAMDWKKVEVIGVSGKEVVLRYTEKLKNGSFTEHSGCVHVIEDIEHPSWINCSYYSDYYFGDTVVAANLTEGDWLHSSGPCGMPWHLVNKTEVRTYLGVSRWVNIMKNPRDASVTNWIFDVETGMLLEFEEIGPNNQRSSHSVVETNIFFSPESSLEFSLLQENIATNVPTGAFYTTTEFFATFVVVSGIIFKKQKLNGGENDQK